MSLTWIVRSTHPPSGNTPLFPYRHSFIESEDILRLFTCSICNDILQYPVICIQGHPACRDCVLGSSNASEILQANCRICHLPILDSTTNYFTEKVAMLKRRCKFTVHGCDLVGENDRISEYESSVGHLNLLISPSLKPRLQCPYEPYDCRYKCGQLVLIKDAKKHRAVCDAAPIPCPRAANGCHQTYPRSKASQHDRACRFYM